jgi:multicomponent Na+:H+ antiporter subunit D
MPLTAVCGIIGALAISSFPLTSGFTAKALITEAAKHEHLVWVYFLLTAASAGVFLHAGIKYPWYVFFQKDSGLRPKDAPWNMGAAMVLFAAACIFLGVYPKPLYDLLPYPVDYTAYTASNVLFYLQLLLFSGLAFFLLLPMMKRTLTITLDTDWLWRVVGLNLVQGLVGAYRNLAGALSDALTALRQVLVARVLPLWKPGGLFADSASIGATALWMIVVLTAYVAMEFWSR